ncbi:MAG: hypothetical protein V3S11_01575, partial [Elusimicrobiota bacterium]
MNESDPSDWTKMPAKRGLKALCLAAAFLLPLLCPKPASSGVLVAEPASSEYSNRRHVVQNAYGIWAFYENLN